MEDTTKLRTDRADSTASTASTTSAGIPSSTSAMPPTSPSVGRRSSHGLFEGLTAQKRNNDPVSLARRQSMNDQRPKPGFIGQMWSKYVLLLSVVFSVWARRAVLTLSLV